MPALSGTHRYPEPVTTPRIPSRGLAAVAGAAAGTAAIGINEVMAGLLPGAPSFVAEVGALVISLQPPGAKQFVVDLFGTNDKLVFNLLIAAVAIGGAAVLGVIGRHRFEIAVAGFVGAGLTAMAISVLQDPLVSPILAIVSTVVTVGVGLVSLRALLALAAPDDVPEMPDFARRRFLGTSLALAGVAVSAGVIGRLMGEGGQVAEPVELPPIPEPGGQLADLPAGADLGLDGLSPVVTPNEAFYRIDTALITPRLDAATWQMTVTGMVERQLTLTYADLLARPMVEQYVTIACVSNEVGGDLVGNALWRGALLRDLLAEAGVRADATQVVGRAYDGWTCGFPTEWVMTEERDALVAVAMNDEPLPAEHGFPARLIVPGLFGYVSATKWLTNLELTTWDAFDGYWVPLGWAKEGPILTQSRIDLPRDGATVAAGEVAVAGVAWAPDRGIQAVEVSVDGGPFQPAELAVAISDATWVQWRFAWDASSGQHSLQVRATDGTGAVQESRQTRPAPDGARGYHSVLVTVG